MIGLQPKQVADSQERAMQSPSPSMSAEQLRARLAFVDEINVDMALRNTAGNPALAVRMLSIFASRHEAGLSTVGETNFSISQSRQQWQRACHDVRGALDTMGAQTLAQEAAALERDLENPLDFQGLAERALHLHARVQSLAHRLGSALG